MHAQSRATVKEVQGAAIIAPSYLPIRIILYIRLTTAGFVMSWPAPCTMSTSSTLQPALRMHTATRPTPETKGQEQACGEHSTASRYRRCQRPARQGPRLAAQGQRVAEHHTVNHCRALLEVMSQSLWQLHILRHHHASLLVARQTGKRAPPALLIIATWLRRWCNLSQLRPECRS